MNTKIKLTIGIPTYNGEDTIKKTLDSVIASISEAHTESVDIMVSDNASTDKTPDIIREYIAKYNFIKYYRNEANIALNVGTGVEDAQFCLNCRRSFDNNVDTVVKRADGDFVWIMADDDIVYKRSVEKVLKVIEKHPDLGILYTCGNWANKGKLKEDRIALSPDEFLLMTNFGSGGISANIINRNIWESIDTAKYYGTGWIHFGSAIEIAAKSRAFVFHEDLNQEQPAIEKRRGAQEAFTVMLNLVKIFSRMTLYGYDQKTEDKAVEMIKNTNKSYIPFFYKPRGLRVDLNLIKECIGLYKSYPSFWLIDLPLLLMPGIIFRVLYKFYNINFVRKITEKLKNTFISEKIQKA